MAGNIVLLLAAGLLMFICVQSGSSEVVPDGVVYTEVKKTLVQGVHGILTCRFYRDPIAVYWKKGSNPDDASLMVIWHEGQVSGPQYNDGSCDIDENYSLIIKNVSLVDVGRFYCIVSNYLGYLIDNYTDVFVVDNAIETESQVTLQMRPYLRGEVRCTVHIRPRTVSWIKQGTANSSDETLVIFENNGTVVKRSGVAYEGGLYNITENYSLVINDVTVHSEGFFTCNATDFDTGITFQDDTLVNVVAQPLEPFPTILECLRDQSDLNYCSIDAETALTITCQVSEYYPRINLIFLYGSTKIESVDTREQNNTDGTKNKTIMIAARGSKELYTCVAFNIPGTPLNRSTSALLHDREHFNRVILVVVMILFAALALISVVAYVLCRKRHSTCSHVQNTDQAELRATYGHVQNTDQAELREFSPLGVTELAPKVFESLQQHLNDVSMLHFREICGLFKTKPTFQTKKIIGENKAALFNPDQMIADWSQRRSSGQIIQAIQLTSKTGDVKDSAWPSDGDLQRISCHLTKESMTTVCQKLHIDCESRDFDDKGKILEVLHDWRNKKTKESVENKHKELFSALNSSNVRDWSQRGTTSQISQEFQATSEAKDSAWPSDEELQWISYHLTKESMTTICQKLHVDCKSRDFDDIGKILEGLHNWRNKEAKKSVENKHMELSQALNSSNLRGLLPPIKGPFVYKVEVVDMAFQLLVHDLLRTTEALDINVTKVISYRPSFKPFHLSIGTIGILSKLLQSNASEILEFPEERDRRSFFCNVIGKQYRRVATKGMFVYDMSYGELESISAEMKKISERTKPEREESASGERNRSSGEPSTPHVDEEDETDTDHAESRLLEQLNGQKSELEKKVRDHQTVPRFEVPKDLVDLKNVLQLTNEDIADGLQSHLITGYELFKIWKEKPRSSVYNYRAALAHYLRGINMSSLADEVIAGKYIKEQTSREFILTLVRGLSQDQLRSLGKLLKLSGKDEQWHTSTFDVICHQIYEWVVNWTKEMKKSPNILKQHVREVFDSVKEASSISSTTSEKHRDLNDELVEHGFLDLAREIMIIEQQIK